MKRILSLLSALILALISVNTGYADVAKAEQAPSRDAENLGFYVGASASFIRSLKEHRQHDLLITPSFLLGTRISESFSLDAAIRPWPQDTLITLRPAYHFASLPGLSIGPKLGAGFAYHHLSFGLFDAYFTYGASIAYDIRLNKSNTLGIEASLVKFAGPLNSWGNSPNSVSEASIQANWKYLLE